MRYRNRHLQEPLQRPNHIQLMELRAKPIRWKILLDRMVLGDVDTHGGGDEHGDLGAQEGDGGRDGQVETNLVDRMSWN